MSLFDRFPFMSLAVAAVLAGCGGGPEIGDVTGTVRVNGQPLPYAYVVFQPVDPPGAYDCSSVRPDTVLPSAGTRCQFAPPDVTNCPATRRLRRACGFPRDSIPRLNSFAT
jgi:hypothetical protein